MLVLSRKKGESIVIGDEIEVSIVDIQAEQVKLAINAPRHISVHRKEIYLQIQEENKASANSNSKAFDMLNSIVKKETVEKKD
ncbi:MAG: carbon storage regulator CsrA [Clostridia bacterium]|nr:carbon storage regulator CsrA [Clostridia bacterium]